MRMNREQTCRCNMENCTVTNCASLSYPDQRISTGTDCIREKENSCFLIMS